MNTANLVIRPLEPVYAGLGKFTDVAVRVLAGALLVPHGAQKLFGSFGGYGLEGTAQFFEQSLGYSNGYLTVLSVGSVEFFGGILLAIGLLTRISAAAIAVLLAVAFTVHLPNGMFWTSGGYEYPLMWALIAATFAIKGGGYYSVDRLIGKEL